MRDALAKNRTEELGDDVWEQFVVPPFFDQIDVQTATKPRVIVGGRGSGKTMLLRYLSHESAFSPKRTTVPLTAVEHIGLYWRADTHFASAMQKRGIPDDDWDNAFSHAFALSVGAELLRSLRSIARSAYAGVTDDDVSRISSDRLRAFDSELPPALGDLYEALEERQWALEAWVSNIRKMPAPLFLPGERFLRRLIEVVRSQLPGLQNAGFCIYVDEYENLLPSQKRIINTWLKHARSPLMIHVAVKRNAFGNRETTGPESLSDVHDFRYHDLERYYEQASFPTFAAEILFQRLSEDGVEKVPIDIEDLRRPDMLPARRESAYRQRVLQAAESLLPGMSSAELARGVFEDGALSRKLVQRIGAALKETGSSASADDFFRPAVPEASIVTPALLYRKKTSPGEIARELDLLEAGEMNRFTGSTAWIHNNFVASLLQLYDPGSRACPVYAGFATFCILARGNLRHFLELCYRSLHQEWGEATLSLAPIPPTKQAEAAREASVNFLHEIRTFGDRGDHLRTFVLRLGTLFELAHRRPTLSETEQSHFSIERGRQPLPETDVDFLREATKWSVLIEEESTKTKSDEVAANVDYVLNPIYAPYFYISYRKKRKLVLSSTEVSTLIGGSADAVTEVLRNYKRKWALATDDVALTLFSILDSE